MDGLPPRGPSNGLFRKIVLSTNLTEQETNQGHRNTRKPLPEFSPEVDPEIANQRWYSLSDLQFLKSETCAPVAYKDKVYNIYRYMHEFHPGGSMTIEPFIGKEIDKIMAQVHPWVRGEEIMKPFYIGNLIKE